MQNKLSLFPNGTEIDATGQLTLHGHRFSNLAQQFGTPLYVYDVETIRTQIAVYQQALSRYHGTSHLTYASKAFQCPALAKLMTAEGVGLDVASAGEIYIAQQGGANPANMHLHGNNKTPLDLQMALNSGVGRIVVDNADELNLLTKMAAGLQQQQQQMKIWLRVTPDVSVETHHKYTVTGTADSKFGFSLSQVKEVATKILAQSDTSPVQLTGLHIHLGSHFYDAEPVAEALEVLLDVAISLSEQFPGWSLAELCPGGGWGVRYHPTDPPIPIEPFVSGVVAAVEQECKKRGLELPTLILEPGRSLVAQAGIAVYTVGGRKVIPNVRTYVSVDGGLADNPRPALYQAQYTALLANKAAQPETETVAIAGPFCESGDVLIRSVDLPLATPGDTLVVPVAGAYQLAMSSNYNAALKPAVIFIDSDGVKLVQRRETFEDLVRRDMI